MSCRHCHCDPCKCENSCDPKNESLRSMLLNFILSQLGQPEQVCINGEVKWVLPCVLDDGSPNFLKLPGESIDCYFLRWLESLSGGSGGIPFLVANNLSEGDLATKLENLGLTNLLRTTDVGSLVQAWCSNLDSICSLTDALGFLKNDGAGNLSWQDTQAKYAVMQDLKADLTSGGAFVLGAWRKRDLQTIAFDPSSIITSLVASEFTLGAGDYIIRSICPAYGVSGHQTRIYNVTNGVQLALGQCMYAAASGPGSVSGCAGFVSLATPKVFRIEHFSGGTNADGFGLAAGTGVGEVYTIVEVLKIK